MPRRFAAVDGGIVHAQTAERALNEVGVSFPVFGMVKDDRHRTRALVTTDGQEISIDTNQAIFSLIGNIQEETHRFAITYHRQLRSKRLRYSELDGIAGVGPKRKQEILKQFKSIKAIGEATLADLERLLPRDAAPGGVSPFPSHGGEPVPGRIASIFTQFTQQKGITYACYIRKSQGHPAANAPGNAYPPHHGPGEGGAVQHPPI